MNWVFNAKQQTQRNNELIFSFISLVNKKHLIRFEFEINDKYVNKVIKTTVNSLYLSNSDAIFKQIFSDKHESEQKIVQLLAANCLPLFAPMSMSSVCLV